MSERYRPLALVLGLVLLPAGFVNVAERLLQRDLSAVAESRQLGLDYSYYYEASLNLRSGVSPYAEREYIPTPLPAILNLPLTWLGVNAATLAAFVLAFLAMVGVVVLAPQTFFEPGSEDERLSRHTGVLVMLFSYPFLLLLDRLNIDAFVVLLVCAGVLLARRREFAGGLLLGVAAAMKVYPALILVPLVIFGRRRALAGLFAALAVVLLITPGLWWEFLTQGMPYRMRYVGIAENGSLAAPFLYLGLLWSPDAAGNAPLEPAFWVSAAYGLYALLLGAKVLGDWRSRIGIDETERLARTFLYFPFMVAIPKVSYHYTLIILIPLIPAVLSLWRRATDEQRRRPLRLAATGVGLGQFPAVAMERMTGSVLPHVVPAAGLLAVMIGAVLVGWRKVP